MRRFTCLAATTVVTLCLLGAAPAFATTTETCPAPVITHYAAPAVGGRITVHAGVGGTVTIKRTSATALKVISVQPVTGWTDVVNAATGTVLRVRLTGPEAGVAHVIHFHSHIDTVSGGLFTRVIDCTA